MCADTRNGGSGAGAQGESLRPAHKARIRELHLLTQTFREIPKSRFCLSVNPLRSRISVRRLATPTAHKATSLGSSFPGSCLSLAAGCQQTKTTAFFCSFCFSRRRSRADTWCSRREVSPLGSGPAVCVRLWWAGTVREK
jgi:hypothetical protein